MPSKQNSQTCHCGADADISLNAVGWCVEHMPRYLVWRTTHLPMPESPDPPENPESPTPEVFRRVSQFPVGDASQRHEMVPSSPNDTASQHDWREYIRTHGDRCPYCDSTELRWQGLAAEGPKAEQQVICYECGAGWTNLYRLSLYGTNDRVGPGNRGKDRR